MKAGEYIELLGPLGSGYKLDDQIDDHIIVGGGLGIPPLLELVKNLKGKKTVYLGFRSDSYLIEDFEKLGIQVLIATDDGSEGMKGTVVDLLKQDMAKGKMIYACGPKPMLKAVSQWAEINDIRAQLSLEERMGCGIGTCVGCVVRIKNEDSWDYKKVCTDGPVFWSEEVVWDV